MFYTIQRRTPLGVLEYRTDRDVSGWTVNPKYAVTFGSEAAAVQRAVFDSRRETGSLDVVCHDGDGPAIPAARHRAVVTCRNGVTFTHA